MAGESIEADFEVFVHDGDVAFGAVREVAPGGRPELVIYVENTGEFIVPLSAIRDVHDAKVILDFDKIDVKLREAIARAHAAEDPWIADRTDE